MIDDCTPILKDLELLARRWDEKHTDSAEDLRLVVSAYLEPGLKVKYVYANQWRAGTLLVRPTKNNACWQIKRDGFGGYIDQVVPDQNTIRINLEAYA